MKTVKIDWNAVASLVAVPRVQIIPRQGLECIHLPATKLTVEMLLVLDGDICWRKRMVKGKWSRADQLSYRAFRHYLLPLQTYLEQGGQ